MQAKLEHGHSGKNRQEVTTWYTLTDLIFNNNKYFINNAYLEINSMLF